MGYLARLNYLASCFYIIIEKYTFDYEYRERDRNN